MMKSLVFNHNVIRVSINESRSINVELSSDEEDQADEQIQIDMMEEE